MRFEQRDRTWDLAGLGCALDVESPPELARELRRLGEQLRAVADPTTPVDR